MRIGSVDALARAIGFDPGVRTAELEAAVNLGTLNLVGELGTELDRASVMDTFYITPGGCLPVGTLYRTRLALSRGFVDGDVTLTFGMLPTALISSFPVDTLITVNKEKGEVVITGPDLTNQYVGASYTAGFDVNPDDPETYTGLPGWLEDIGLLAAMAALDNNQPVVRYDLKNRQSVMEAQASAKSLQAQVTGRLLSKARYFPNAVHPL